MNDIYQHLPEVISPAIIFAVFAYLTNFFGKTMSDQKSFSDDRGWEIQLHGISFILQYIAPSSYLGFLIASHLGTLDTPFALRIFIVLTITIWVSFVNQEMGKKLYGLPPSIKPEQRAAFKAQLRETFKKHGYSEQASQKVQNVLASTARAGESMIVNRKVYRFVIATFYMWMLIAEILRYVNQGFSLGELIQVTLLIALVFFGFFCLAFNKSLAMYKKLNIVDIYPVGDLSPLLDVSLLKVNDHNVRFLVGTDRLVIMNWDQINRIEELRSKNPDS